jgi:glycosyltransferase involved in cell wall biosynthesis
VKILFTSTQRTSFITQDLNVLRKHFVVDHVITRGVFAPFGIFIRILRADITYTWFASVYAFVVVFLSRLMGKRSILVIGGVDVAKVPELRYGIWLSPWKALLVKYALRNASKVLAVDSSLQKKAIELADYSGENIECVPTGYDSGVWVPNGTKEPLILTIAACNNVWKMRVKGLDVLFECARTMASTRFVVIGLAPQLLNERHSAPANVELLPFVEQTDLLRYYQRAKVYCQPSFVEGLPNSVCEAMLCGCVPVGTNVGGIPTAIGDCGFLVPYGNVHKLVEAIRNALQSPDSVGQSARERIAREFTLKRREEALLRIIREAAK